MGSLVFKKGVDKFKDLSTKQLKDIEVTDINGASKKIEEFIANKKAIIFVNVASKCGYTDASYKQLVDLYAQYKDEGLEVLAFPCNQFMKQESKSESEIACFVQNYKVKFPMFSKISVNGPDTHELYLYLKQHSDQFNLGDGKLKEIPWNFTKFMVDSEGKVVGFYDQDYEPKKMEPDILKLLH